MTSSPQLHPVQPRLDVDAAAPRLTAAISRLDEAASWQLERADVPAGLRDLLRLRASQLNGCTYCVDTHAADAVTNGESQQRVNALAVWRESSLFDSRERAALAFTESVTRATETHVPQQDFDEVSAHWTTDEVAAILALIVSINAWNLVGVATRTWETPGA